MPSCTSCRMDTVAPVSRDWQYRWHRFLAAGQQEESNYLCKMGCSHSMAQLNCKIQSLNMGSEQQENTVKTAQRKRRRESGCWEPGLFLPTAPPHPLLARCRQPQSGTLYQQGSPVSWDTLIHRWHNSAPPQLSEANSKPSLI